MAYYDPNAGLNDDMQGIRGGIAERMYKRLHDEHTATPQQPSKAKGPKIARAPIALICYLCGQQYGTASLEIHQKQCFAKKMLQWERGDPETRGPRPVLRAPSEHVAINDGINDSRGTNQYGKMTSKEMEQFNNNQFQDYQQKALVPCDNCGRTFLPDRLQVHLRSCKPGATARPVRKAGDPASPVGPSSGPSSSSYNAQSQYDNKPLPKRPSATNDAATAPAAAQPLPQRRVPSMSGGSADPSYLDSYDDMSDRGDRASIDEGGNGLLRGASDVGSSRPHTATSYDDARSASAKTPTPSPAEGRRSGGPVIPQLHLQQTQAPQPSGDDSDGIGYEDELYDMPEEFNEDDLLGDPNTSASGVGHHSEVVLDDDDFQSVGSTQEPFHAPTYDSPSASPPLTQQQPTPSKPKPKVAIDRPLDLSHVQSRFKAAAVSNLERCQFCNRTFAPDRLARHEDVCIEKKTMKTGGAAVGMTPRVSGKGPAEPVVRPATSNGPATGRAGNVTSRVASSGYGTSRGLDGNGSLTNRGGPSTGNKIIRPANASSRPVSPSVGRHGSRSPPPAQRPSVERGPAARVGAGGTASRIIQPRQQSPAATRPAATRQTTPPPTFEEAPRLKFCTECGTKLFTATQKFCGECGYKVQ